MTVRPKFVMGYAFKLESAASMFMAWIQPERQTYQGLLLLHVSSATKLSVACLVDSVLCKSCTV